MKTKAFTSSGLFPNLSPAPPPKPKPINRAHPGGGRGTNVAICYAITSAIFNQVRTNTFRLPILLIPSASPIFVPSATPQTLSDLPGALSGWPRDKFRVRLTITATLSNNVLTNPLNSSRVTMYLSRVPPPKPKPINRAHPGGGRGINVASECRSSSNAPLMSRRSKTALPAIRRRQMILIRNL